MTNPDPEHRLVALINQAEHDLAADRDPQYILQKVLDDLTDLTCDIRDAKDTVR